VAGFLVLVQAWNVDVGRVADTRWKCLLSGSVCALLVERRGQDMLKWLSLVGFESCSRNYLQYWQSVSKLSLWRLSWAMSGVDCTTSMAYRGMLRCRECLVSSRRFQLIVDGDAAPNHWWKQSDSQPITSITTSEIALAEVFLRCMLVSSYSSKTIFFPQP
jgi:hypothetical protein